MSMSIVIADPSTVALDPAPITPGWILEGNPQARAKELARSDSQVTLVPYDQAYGAGFDDMRKRVPDTTKLRTLIGWAPVHTLDDILTETIAEARAEQAEELALSGEHPT